MTAEQLLALTRFAIETSITPGADNMMMLAPPCPMLLK